MLAAAQCIVIGPVCLCMSVFVGLLSQQLKIVCIDPHQTGFVDKGSVHFQLIKFWQYHTPGKWVCSGAKIFGLALLQPAHSVYVSLSAFVMFRAGTNTQYHKQTR